MKKILVGSLLAGSLLFANNSAQININNDTLEVIGSYSLNDSYDLNEDSNYFLTLSYLRSEKDNTKTQKLTTVGLKIVNPYIDDKGLSLGIGVKALWADNYTKDFIATPLEVFATYTINEKVSIDLSSAYAPKILTYKDGEKYQDLVGKINYKVIDNGYIYIGARSIKTNYKDDIDVKYDNKAFFGYKVQF